jgi:hypothetical protein
MASSTTIPSETLVEYVSSCPLAPEPRHTLKLAVRAVVPALVFDRAAARCPLSAILREKDSPLGLTCLARTL